MRITRLQARDIGRHRDLDIELAPGVTVVRGPNEAGKSTIQRIIELALTRKVTSSTVPIAGSGRLGTESRIRSPKPYWRSVMMKKPARMSWTMRWAPNPIATAATAAGATRLVTGIPRRARIATPVAQ